MEPNDGRRALDSGNDCEPPQLPSSFQSALTWVSKKYENLKYLFTLFGDIFITFQMMFLSPESPPFPEC